VPAKKTAKKATPAKQQNTPLNTIQELSASIQKMEGQLNTAFEKALPKLKKKNATAKEKLNPLKEKLAQAKLKLQDAKATLKNKKTAANTNRVAKSKVSVQTIQEKMAVLKAEFAITKLELNEVQESFKLFSAKQKAVLKISSAAKKPTKKKTKRTKSKKAVEVVAPATES
jgi:chromosome segregation ATPase